MSSVKKSRKLRRAETIHEPRDVGIARDHAFTDLPGGKRVRMTAAENAEHVVLAVGEIGVGLGVVGEQSGEQWDQVAASAAGADDVGGVDAHRSAGSLSWPISRPLRG